MRICEYPECNKKHHSGGLCSLHYNRKWRKENPTPKVFRKCTVEGCNNRYSGRGYCKTHLNRLKRCGDIQVTKHNMSGCKVEGCDNRSASKEGYCSVHSRRYKSTGNPLLTKLDIKRSLPKRGCQVLGCTKKRSTKDYCDTHYMIISEICPDMSKTFEDLFGNPPYSCYLCGHLHETWDTSKVWHDHVIPVTKGGTYTLENIKPACRSCNRAKSNMDLEKFIDMCHRVASLHPNLS